MKKSFIFFLITISILLLPITTFANYISNKSKIVLEYEKDQQKILDDIPTIGCNAVYIAEPTTGKIFYEKKAHTKMYPASTTKILTALLVLENCKLTDTAIVSKHALDLVPSGYSDAGLVEGEELDILSLLKALLIPSANEAANVLAEHVSGSVESFVELCNKRAEELGCESLHFVNPNGIHDENHYCTAYDLYLIAKECQKHEIFNEIVKTTSFTVPATNKYPKNDRTYKNTNELLLLSSSKYYYPYCTGIKTGYTTPAGNCLVASSSNNGIDLISVVLDGKINRNGLNERFYDTKQLFEFVYNNYSIKEIFNQNKAITTINIKNATKETASLDIVVNTGISTIVPNDIDIDNIEKTVTLFDEIYAPIEQNQILGKVTFMVDGLNYTTNLVASHSVEKLPYWLYNLIAVGAFVLILVILVMIVNKKKCRGDSNRPHFEEITKN